VLERQRFRRVGAEREQSVSLRVLSATNRDLRTEVNRGTFRADLYYRLAAARVVIPPLRDRAGDVSLLARHFARELSGVDDALDASVLDALEKQSWQGNVRELRSVVERVVAFGPAELGVDAPAAPREAPPLDAEIVRYRDAKATAIASFDRNYLTHLLETSKNNVSEAARRAQMDRPYLIALLKRHGIR
jgi:DNA-binding NtrC family response regulator